MILNLAVGPQGLLTPGGPNMRGTYDGSLATQDGHARFQEMVYRGKAYCAAQTTGTVMPAGLSASPTTTTLFNPAGSGVNGVIVYASVGNLIAWSAAAMVWVAENFAVTSCTGTAGLCTNLATGAAVLGGASIKVLTTVTINAAPTNVVMALGAGLTGAITTVPSWPSLGGFLEGAILLAPGNVLSFQSSTQSGGGAASSFGMFIYEEVPINMG